MRHSVRDSKIMCMLGHYFSKIIDHPLQNRLERLGKVQRTGISEVDPEAILNRGLAGVGWGLVCFKVKEQWIIHIGSCWTLGPGQSCEAMGSVEKLAFPHSMKRDCQEAWLQCKQILGTRLLSWKLGLEGLSLERDGGFWNRN